MLMANETDFNALREGLHAELEKAQQRLNQLKKAYDALTPPDGQGPGKYAGMRVWIAVREYLRAAGGKASVTEILDDLERGGAKLGKYPLRTIKIAVNSPYMRQIFKVEALGDDDVVSLRKDDGGRESPGASRPRATPAGKRPLKR